MKEIRRKKIKAAVSLSLCVILILTSLPFAMALSGTYDPIPVFNLREDMAPSELAAWYNDDGGISVRFPAAQANKSRNANKFVEKYIVQLIDLGLPSEEHKSVVIAERAMPAPRAETLSFDIPASMLTGVNRESRINVRIVAVDNEGWLSQAINILVSSVPQYVYDAESTRPFVTSQYALREMMSFNGRGNASGVAYSNNGNGSGDMDYRQTGNQLAIFGMADNSSSRGTTSKNSLRFQLNGTGAQSFDTAWSRQMYDFSGAQEIWFYLDLSQVELKDLSFRLRYNEKRWRDLAGRWNDWNGEIQSDVGKDMKDGTRDDMYSNVIYSTKGYSSNGGQGGYVFVAQENGSWKKVYLNSNGGIDLGHFCGYIRVPIQFMCSETDSFIQLKNTRLGENYRCDYGDDIQNYSSLSNNTDKLYPYLNDLSLYPRTMNGIDEAPFTDQKLLVDKAGTPISTAMLLQRRFYNNAWDYYTRVILGIKTGWQSTEWFTKAAFNNANMLAAAVQYGNNGDNVRNGPRATTYKDGNGNWQIDRTNGFTAMQDLMGAGFAYSSASGDSLNQSFFLNSVMFYRSDGQQYHPENGNNYGQPVSDYYDQKSAVINGILNEIERYLPYGGDWSDYAAVAYLTDFIDGYRRAYSEAGQDASFLSDDSLRAASAAMGRGLIWDRYANAKQSCIEEDMYGKTNALPDDIVSLIAKDLEKLPRPETITSMSGELENMLLEITKAYTNLNLSQLDMFGKQEETDILAYMKLLDNAYKNHAEVVSGKVADYPYILFNDFENPDSYEGRHFWHYENDANANNAGTLANDYRHTRGLVTYSADYVNYLKYKNINTVTPQSAQGINTTWAKISKNGFSNSNGAEIRINSPETGYWHSVSFSYDSRSANSFGEFKNNKISLREPNIGNLAGRGAMAQSNGKIPLSLVFYVDFSEMKSYDFSVNIHTVNSSGQDATYMQNISGLNYYILNSDGDWVGYPSNYNDHYSSENIGSYKGYLMIPLYNMYSGSECLDNDPVALSNIYSIQFSVGWNTAAIDGSSYVLDNIGFMYDPSVVSTGTGYVTYAELFGAKSSAAVAFEEAVKNINPYDYYVDYNNFSVTCSKAGALYNNLTLSQKNLPSVQQVYKIFRTYESFNSNMYPATRLTPQELVDKLNSLDTKTINASIDGINDLPYPGYVKNGAMPEVNFAAYGISDEAQMNDILSYFTESYKRFNTYQKQEFAAMTTADGKPAVTSLVNAYNAAARCQNLLSMLAGVEGVELQIRNNLYTKVESDQTHCLEIANRATILDIDNSYKNLPYYAKKVMTDGSATYDASFAKAPLAVEKVLNNTAVYKNLDIKGGILLRQEEYAAFYKDVVAKHLSEKTTFTDAELIKMNALVDEYNSYLPAYHNIAELYEGIEAIIKEFPVYEMGFTDGTKKEEALKIEAEKALTGSVNFQINYAEEFYRDEFDGTDVGATFFTAVKAGEITNAELPYTVSFNGWTVGTELSAQTLNNEFAPGYNNTKTPIALPVTVTFPSDSVPSPELTDMVTVKHYRPVRSDDDESVIETVTVNGTAQQAVLIDTYVLKITYSKGATYSVEIPSAVNVDWDDTAPQDVGYTVKTSLYQGSTLDVSITDSVNDTDKQLRKGENGLPYTADSGFAKATFTGNTNEKHNANVTIAKDDWDASPIAVYETTLTYTADYTE